MPFSVVHSEWSSAFWVFSLSDHFDGESLGVEGWRNPSRGTEECGESETNLKRQKLDFQNLSVCLGNFSMIKFFSNV